MQGILPQEALALLQAAKIKGLEAAISNEVEHVLLKLWEGGEPSRAELNLDITPSELAAIWTFTHRRPVFPDTARQVLRRTGKGAPQIKPSREWGSGPTLRRLYRLEDVLEVHIRDTGKRKSPEQGQQ